MSEIDEVQQKSMNTGCRAHRISLSGLVERRAEENVAFPLPPPV
jgi:hypothetical protein